MPSPAANSDIELDTRLPYRVGSPKLLALPLETKYDALIRDWDAVVDKAVEVLQKNGVGWRYCGTVKRFHRGADVSLVRPSLLVESDVCIGGQYSRWKSCVTELRRFFLQQGRNITVEIIDTGASEELLSLPLTSRQIATWYQFAPQIIERVKDREWVSLDPLRRSFRRPNAKAFPTAVISALDADDKTWWEEILPDLSKIAPDDFQVELLYCPSILPTVMANANQQETPAPWSYITMNAYDKTVKTGASIGRKGTNGAGTIGAYIELQGLKDKYGLGLTNHHVVGNDDDIKEACEEKGWLEPNHKLVKQKSLAVVSPADCDHARLVDKMKAEIAGAKASLGKLPTLQEEITSSMEATRQQLEDDITKLQNNISECRVTDRLFGSVFASSNWRTITNPRFTQSEVEGWSIVNTDKNSLREPRLISLAERRRILKWIVDWSLVELTKNRPMSLSLSPTTSQVMLDPRCLVTRYYKLKPDRIYPVVKVGRSTGWTAGEVNAAASYLNLRLHKQRKTSVVPADLTHRYPDFGLAWGIIPLNRKQDFIFDGDSGCTVLLNKGGDEEAFIVGLGFASNKATMVSYMQPFDLVVMDIETVTGAKVIFPTYAGEEPGGTPPDSP